MNADSIPTQVEEFFSLLETRNIEYVLVNGIALLTYVEGRNTRISTSSWHCHHLQSCPK